MHKKPHNFWQELKRRKVVRVMIGYAASSYVILELISIIAEPFGLPEWTLRLVFVLLCVGFIIAVALSWLYDFTPRGIEKTRPIKLDRETEPEEKASKRKLRASDVIITVLLVAVVVLAYPKVFNKGGSLFDRAFIEKKSIAVLPFINNTGNEEYDSWEFGISNLIITYLSGSNELTVVDNQTIYEVIDNTKKANYASIGPEIAKEVATRINVDSYIYGDFFLAGSTFRINLKLIDTKNSEILYTDFEEGITDSIIVMTGSLSDDIKDFLEMEVIREGTNMAPSGYVTTKSAEAYKYFIQGVESYWIGRNVVHPLPLEEAIRIDSSFSEAYLFLSLVHSSWASYSSAKELLRKADEGQEKLSPSMKLVLEAWKAIYFEKNPHKAINYFKRVTEIDPYSLQNWYWLGWSYYSIEDYAGALSSVKQISKITKHIGPWKSLAYYSLSGDIYEKMGKYKKAQKISREGLRLYPGASDLISLQARCAILQNDTVAANQYIKNYKIALSNTGIYPESLITGNEGKIYIATGQYRKAEELLKLALKIRLSQDVQEIDTVNPGNNLFWYYDVLAYPQILGDINVEEGIQNAMKALELCQNTNTPDHPNILRILGLGYYKQGKYEEALRLFREAAKGMTLYDHFLHQNIKETEQALSNQKIRN